ncbi:MAG: Lin0512 family protein [Pseudomonadota bacterium]
MADPDQMHRVIIEMGMGNDQYGMDYTKAAARAIEDAIRHSALPLFAVTGLTHAEMRVKVTVGVQEPGKLDLDALAQKLPRGKVEVVGQLGGLNVPVGAETIVVAQAAVEAFLPRQSTWVLKS